MKKILCLFISALLVFSALSFSVSAEEITDGNTKTELMIDRIEEKKEVSVTFQTGRSKTFGDKYSPVNTIHIKGDKIAYDFDNGFFMLRSIVENNSLVSYFPAFPFIYMNVDNLSFGNVNLWETINSLSNFTMDFLVFVRCYEKNIDGTDYYVEEFSDRGVVINSFYYIGDDLKILRAEDFGKDTVQYTYFNNLSLTVDDNIFNKPQLSFNLSGLIKLFLSIFA